jgi:hypothetical protein
MEVKTAENPVYCDQTRLSLMFIQVHHLNVVGLNPTPATNHFVKPVSDNDTGLLV